MWDEPWWCTCIVMRNKSRVILTSIIDIPREGMALHEYQMFHIRLQRFYPYFLQDVNVAAHEHNMIGLFGYFHAVSGYYRQILHKVLISNQ